LSESSGLQHRIDLDGSIPGTISNLQHTTEQQGKTNTAISHADYIQHTHSRLETYDVIEYIHYTFYR